MDTAIKIRDFESQILYFNGMYKLPVAEYPSTEQQAEHERLRVPEQCKTVHPVISRLQNFKKIILDEIDEVDDIILSIQFGIHIKKGKAVEPQNAYTEIDLLTDLSDWLGDLQVFCASEMARYGLPLKEVLRIIMQSNFSKLGADGKPMYDSTGKVQKGPGYWKPEPQIKAMLEELIAEKAILAERTERSIVWRD